MTRADRLSETLPEPCSRPQWSDLTIVRPVTPELEELPAQLQLSSTFPFVGRTGELERLRALMPRAQGESRRVVLLGGEPGSGKSRLVREFAAEAAAGGAIVLYGACDAEVRTPYGPFVQALDRLARSAEPAELRDALGSGGGELTRLLPDLPTRVEGLAPAIEADPDTERHRLHTAVADLLAGITRGRPALLVLEDAHWADAPTLLLLRHLARNASGRVLLLATFRHPEADVTEALSEALADLRRFDVVRLALGGLSADEVAEFVQRAAGRQLNPELRRLAGEIGALTEGNPFLVCELWRALVETGSVELDGPAIRIARPPAELSSPESVREVVSQRLSRLGAATIDLLELAAAAGSQFDLDVVRRAAGLDEPELLATLDEAVRSGMIEELPTQGLACRFTHELVRRALYDRLSGPRRAELHLRVGEALEEGQERSGRALADLAHHFAAAAPFGDSGRAVAYNLLAARAAMAALAYGEAASRLRTVLELGIADPSERQEAYLELGEASHRGGNSSDALEAFRSTAVLARERGDQRGMARAAIGYEDACWRPGIADHGAVELLKEAVAALGEEASGLRVGLLGGLARALDFQGYHSRAANARVTAVEMARRLDDRVGLATVLVRSYWARGTTPLDEIVEMLSEARDIGQQLGDTEITAEAMSWRVPGFVAAGDLAAARAEVAELRESAEQTAQPFFIHVAEHYGSAIALCDGRLPEAEARALRSQEWGKLLTGRDASGVYGIQMFSVRREQGRLAELAPVVRILAGDATREGPWQPGLVALLAELGMEAEARRELARLTSDEIGAFRESLWLAALAYLAEASVQLRDERVAALVYPELEPLAGSNVMIGHLVSCYGVADRYLGMLATTLGEWDRAEQHFEDASELNRRMGFTTWQAHTAYEYGRLLRLRPGGDPSHAATLLREAGGLADRIGMPTLARRVRALGSAEPAAVTLPDGLSPREVQILRLVARGLSNRQVGAELSISEHTAANHMRSILHKTGCANRTEAAFYAHRHGLVAA